MTGPRLIKPDPAMPCEGCAEEPAYVLTDDGARFCGWCADYEADALRRVARDARRLREKVKAEAEAEERKQAAFDPSTQKPEPITQCAGQLAMETT